ncbi:uncharacterized protein LOC142325424 isoform X2 [Lycorma delicatula]|uniref:uncharacterized protein LOC142325424 isoform X2 n=1 Tax=Lycorma delicatula TaxID=130591 RepID=UPI003F50ED98
MADYSVKMQRSTINQCRRFSQNAWKKDLCSNCFKSKEEHQKPDTLLARATAAHVISTPDSKLKPKQSILKSISSSSAKGNSGANGRQLSSSSVDKNSGKTVNSGSVLKVNFPVEESEIIGYGGDDEFDSSDESDSGENDDDGMNNSEFDDKDDDDDDIDLQRLTKSNTDFNSVTANLTDETISTPNTDNFVNNTKKLHIPLMLGRLNTDSDGQKKTLLVSVKPFGSDVEINTKIKNQKTVCNNINNKLSNNLKSNEKQSVNALSVNKLIDNNDGSDKTSTKNNENEKIKDNKESSENNDCSTSVKDLKNTSDISTNSKVNQDEICSVNKSVLQNGPKFSANSLDSGLKQNSSLEVVSKNVNTNSSNCNDNNNDANSIVNNGDSLDNDNKLQNSIIDSSSALLDNSAIENRKAQITRGTMLTKNHEQVKTKRFQLLSSSNTCSTTATTTTNSTMKLQSDTNMANDVKNNSENNLLLSSNIKNINNKNDDAKDEKEQYTSRGKENCKDNSDTLEKNYIKTQFELNKLISNAVSSMKLQQKNYKNIISDDNKIKCVSFKDYKLNDNFKTISNNTTENINNGLKSELTNKKNGSVNERLSVSDNDDDYDENSCTLPLPLTSRELAGEPDGRADSDDTNEPSPPSLPLTPPPALPTLQQSLPPRSPPATPPPPPPPLIAAAGGTNELHHPPRLSFLHSLQATKIQQQQNQPDKLKVPVKSSTTSTSPTKQQRLTQLPQTQSQEFLSDEGENNCNDNSRNLPQQAIMKRQAPKPPSPALSQSVVPVSNMTNPVGTTDMTVPANGVNASNNVLFIRRASVNNDLDTPVIKARERRNQQLLSNNSSSSTTELATRSASHDSLSFSSPATATAPVTKRGSKVRSTLRKLLRFGSRSDDDVFDDNSTSGISSSYGNNINPNNINGNNCSTPAVRVRPEIIHPLDLNKSGVQVLRNTTNLEQLYNNIKVDDATMMSSNNSMMKPTTHFNTHNGSQQPHPASSSGRPSKPPPPPRSQSLDLTLGIVRGPAPPARPPPPLTSATAGTKTSTFASATNTNSNTSTFGTPSVFPETGLYANLGNSRLEVMPEKPQRSGSLRDKNNASHQLGIIEDPIESDEWKLSDSVGSGRKRHRSVIHSSLEENYGAVVVANHEALSLLLEQANRNGFVPESLDSLKNLDVTLQWKDFVIDETTEPVSVGFRVFYAALYKNQVSARVTLCVSAAVNGGLATDKLPNCLPVIREFNDVIQRQLICRTKTSSIHSQDMIQATVSVLARQTVEPMRQHNWSTSSNGGINKFDVMKEAGVVLYQLTNCLLSLHNRAVDYIYMSDIVLSKLCNANFSIKDDVNYTTLKLSLLPHCQETDCVVDNSNDGNNTNSGEDRLSLYECFTGSLRTMPLPSHLLVLLNKLISEKKPTSVLLAKAILELWLWGPPSDISVDSLTERQNVIQRWLDLERANVLQSLLMSCPLPLKLNTYDHCHLLFLVQTNAKIINDALTLFNDHR